MILVTLGSQKFKFNRVLKMLDELLNEQLLTEEVFAQTGYSDYQPENFNYQKFLDREKFQELISISDTIITHGGTGAIISGLKANKRVLAIPRKSEYGEHVDDHQKEIVDLFCDKKFIEKFENKAELIDLLNNSYDRKVEKFRSGTNAYLDFIREKMIRD